MLALLMGCHSAKPEAQPAADPCRPQPAPCPGRRPPTVSRGNTAYLTATSGASAGRSVESGLRLAPLADSLARAVVVLGVRDTTASHPLAGTSDLDPTALGGVRTGDLTTDDPEAPGVLVIERHPAHEGAGSEIMLRLGSDANRLGFGLGRVAAHQQCEHRAGPAPGPHGRMRLTTRPPSSTTRSGRRSRSFFSCTRGPRGENTRRPGASVKGSAPSRLTA